MVRIKHKVHKQLRKSKKVVAKMDKPLLVIVAVWMVIGFLVFTSAALGLSSKSTELLSVVLLKQSLTLFFAFLTMIVLSKIKFKSLLSAAPYLYVLGILFSLLVFVPGVSFSAGGAHRWISVLGFSFQPAEVMKYSTILFSIFIFLKYRKFMSGIKSLLLPAAVLLFPLTVLFLQPDTSTAMLTVFGVGLAYFLLGAPYKNIFMAVIFMVLTLSVLIYIHPYIKARIMTFLNPETDALGSAYQINQSLIAIGSGGIFGKGFGQGVQKFGYLPEPVGDSIFATFAEEFGFFGVFILLSIFTMFFLRSFKLAQYSKSLASATTIFVFSTTIFVQSLINIAAMSGVMPLTGLTLPLISLGGTSVLATLLAVAVVFSASQNSQAKV